MFKSLSLLKFCFVEEMSGFRIIYALSTMFSLANCYEYSFAFDMPTIFNGFTNMASQALASSQALSSARASQDPDADVEDSTLVGKLQKVTLNAVDYMASMLSTLSRRMTEKKPQVEMGPGSYKSEQVSYPPNYFVNRLKTLLNIKKREEEKNKPINKSK